MPNDHQTPVVEVHDLRTALSVPATVGLFAGMTVGNSVTVACRYLTPSAARAKRGSGSLSLGDIALHARCSAQAMT